MAALRQYIRAAFSARPWGMFIPPNWIALGFFALLGLLTPGFWLLGAGLELGYLYVLCTHPRFRRLVQAQGAQQVGKELEQRLAAQLSRLPAEDVERYRTLAGRCRTILEQQGDLGGAGLTAQGQGLSRLLAIYLRLLLMRRSLHRVLSEASDRATLEDRLAKLRKKLEAQGLGDELRKSLMSQMEILQQRLEGQQQAASKLAFLEAELTRIQEQVELIREQAVLTADSQVVSDRIDQVAATLGDTTQWIREQQQIYGQVEDLLSEPPPLVVPPPSPPPLPRTSQEENA